MSAKGGEQMSGRDREADNPKMPRNHVDLELYCLCAVKGAITPGMACPDI
jgi:hypothetical protein